MDGSEAGQSMVDLGKCTGCYSVRARKERMPGALPPASKVHINTVLGASGLPPTGGNSDRNSSRASATGMEDRKGAPVTPPARAKGGRVRRTRRWLLPVLGDVAKDRHDRRFRSSIE